VHHLVVHCCATVLLYVDPLTLRRYISISDLANDYQREACLTAAKQLRRQDGRHDAELIPFVVETCGGLGQDAIALLDFISGAASEHLSIWLQEDAAKEVLNSQWPSQSRVPGIATR
jgi:hypothetical protein